MAFVWDMRYLQQMLILGPAAAFIGYKLFEKYSLAMSLLFVYCCINSLYLGFGYNYEPAYMHPLIHGKVQLMGSQVFIQLMVFGAFAWLAPKDVILYTMWAAFGYCFLDILFLAFAKGYGFKFGFFNAHSFDTGVLALYIPMFCFAKNRHARFGLLGIGVAGLCFAVGGRTAWAIAGFTAFAYVWSYAPRIVAFTMAFYASIVTYAYSDRILEYANRVDLLKKWWPFFKEDVSLFYGAGLGSFEWIAPFFPDDFGQRRFLAHNDFAQMLFETGLVGLALLLWFIFDIYKKGRKSTQKKLTLFCIVFFMWVYFPLHYLVSELLITCFILMTYKEHQENGRKVF